MNNGKSVAYFKSLIKFHLFMNSRLIVNSRQDELVKQGYPHEIINYDVIGI